jgi:hypothetical protein
MIIGGVASHIIKNLLKKFCGKVDQHFHTRTDKTLNRFQKLIRFNVAIGASRNIKSWKETKSAHYTITA